MTPDRRCRTARRWGCWAAASSGGGVPPSVSRVLVSGGQAARRCSSPSGGVGTGSAALEREQRAATEMRDTTEMRCGDGDAGRRQVGLAARRWRGSIWAALEGE